MPRFLHLKSLKLRNFKGIAELDLALDESLTLLAGVNGVGKTSVMQALVAAVAHACHLAPPHDYPLFRFPASVTHDGTSAWKSFSKWVYRTGRRRNCALCLGETGLGSSKHNH